MKKITASPIDLTREILSAAISPLKSLEIVPGVEAIRHNTELKLLNDTVRYDRFFFIIDIANQSIRLPTGIKQWLGYSEEEFSLSFYTSIIHEHHINPAIILAKAIADMAKYRQSNISFMRERFVAEIALKHAKGHYVLVKHALSYWDFDRNYQIPTAYLNEFTIWREYDSQNFTGINLRVIDFYGARLPEMEEILKENIYKTLEAEKYFSVQELRILRKYAYNADMTTHEIAQAFRISYNTVNIYNRRIMEKCIYLYPNQKLKMAKDVALFLKKENFI